MDVLLLNVPTYKCAEEHGDLLLKRDLLGLNLVKDLLGGTFYLLKDLLSGCAELVKDLLC